MNSGNARASVALCGHSALRIHSGNTNGITRKTGPCTVRSREAEVCNQQGAKALHLLAGPVVNQLQSDSQDVLPGTCQWWQSECADWAKDVDIHQTCGMSDHNHLQQPEACARPANVTLNSYEHEEKQDECVQHAGTTAGQPSAPAASTVTVIAYSEAANRWFRLPVSAAQLCDVQEMIVRQNRRIERRQAEGGRKTLMMLFKLWVGAYNLALALAHKMAVKDNELREMAEDTAHKDEAVQGTADMITLLQLEIAKLKGAVQQAHVDTLAAQEGQRAAEQKQQQAQLELAEVKEAMRQLEMDHRAAEAGGKLARTQLAEAKNELRQALRDKCIAEDAQKEAENELGWRRREIERMEWDHKKKRDAHNKEESAIIMMRADLSCEVDNHNRRVREMLASLLGKHADVLPVVASKLTADDCLTRESVWKATCGAMLQELTATETYAQAAADKLKTKLGISDCPKASDDPLLQILYRKPANAAMRSRRPAAGVQIRPALLLPDRPAANNQSRPAALPPNRPAANHPSRPPGLPVALPPGNQQPRPAAALSLVRPAHDNQPQSAAGTLRHNSRPARSHQSQPALQTGADKDTAVMVTVDDLQEAVSVHSQPCSRVNTTVLSAGSQLLLTANFMFDQLQPSSPTSPRLFVAVH